MNIKDRGGADMTDNTFDTLLGKVAKSAGIEPVRQMPPKPEVHRKKAQYPLGGGARSMTGRALSDIAADDNACDGDIRIRGDVLRIQADTASADAQLSKGLARAAEMTVIPRERLIEMYNILRGGDSDKIRSMAEELEQIYRAPLTAALVRGAAEYKTV
jgi:propanediol dehydratase small subunit